MFTHGDINIDLNELMFTIKQIKIFAISHVTNTTGKRKYWRLFKTKQYIGTSILILANVLHHYDNIYITYYSCICILLHLKYLSNFCRPWIIRMSESVVWQHAHTGWNDLPGALLNTFIKQHVWYYKITINLLSPLGLFYVTKLWLKLWTNTHKKLRNIYLIYTYIKPIIFLQSQKPAGALASLALWPMSCGTDTIRNQL